MVKHTNIITVAALTLITGILSVTNSANSVSALSYQSTTTLDFTINPTITLTVSGDLTIDNLTPGGFSDSNIITVTAESNAISGYSLSSTVGNSTNASTELRKNNTDATNKFSSIASNKTSLSNFDENSNTWGYSYCITSNDCTNTNYWQSGDITNATSIGYNGLPLYTTSSPVKLINSTTPGSNSIKFKIGARTTTTQASGEYTNTINFIGIANPNPPTLADITYMQDVTSDMVANTAEGITFTLKDKRDEQEYRVAKLKDGNIWLLDNLALDLVAVSLDNLKGNTNASDEVLTYLKDGGGSSPNTNVAVTYAGSVNTYDAPLIAVSGTCYDAWCIDKPSNGNWSSNAVTDATINETTSIAQGKIGAYYNYCAASAGSYCYTGDTGTGNAEYDVCPAGWRLPTESSSGNPQALYTAYSSDYSIFQTALSTPLSGYFYSGTARSQGSYGYFWSSTFYGANDMHRLLVSASSVNPSNYGSRNIGISVRCLISS